MWTPTSVEPQVLNKSVGEEPLPGYRLLEPLGVGGFGEVWKCEAPGGLMKAIKFVAGGVGTDGNSLRQEFEAFQQIKVIRHPFLLMLDRVELIRDELIMVMELADHQLQDRFEECRAEGLPGIPRDELLSYMTEAAEALDVISVKYKLQHLDVKPANLFVVAGHVKVGDFGLVGGVQASGTPAANSRGLTPKYTAPEVLRGQVDVASDQYSLALVYQELLTGQFPFQARSVQQMLLQHVSVPPNLKPLSDEDQQVVGKALAKSAAERYPSCTAFVRALSRIGHSVADTQFPPMTETSSPMRSTRTLATPGMSRLPGNQGDPISRTTRPQAPSLTVPAAASPRAPQLTTIRRPNSPMAPSAAPPAGDDDLIDLVALSPAARPQGVILERIWPVMPESYLTGGRAVPFQAPPAAAFAESVVRAAIPGGMLPRTPGDPIRLPDGTWTTRFPVRVVEGVARLKLDVLREQWGGELGQTDANTFVLRVATGATGGSFWRAGKKAGAELVVQLPDPRRPVGEAEIVGRLFGQMDGVLARDTELNLPRMIESVRKQLQNGEERRATTRVPADFALTLYPVHGDGTVVGSFSGQCIDLSQGGLCCLSSEAPEAAHVFVSFPTVGPVTGWAVLLRLTRSHRDQNGFVLAGRYRTDLETRTS